MCLGLHAGRLRPAKIGGTRALMGFETSAEFFRIDMALAGFSLALIVVKSASVSHQPAVQLVPDSPNLFIHVYYVEAEQRRVHENLGSRCA